MEDPAISAADLRVRRGGRLVLPGVSLEVAAGTVTGLLGPSGSGKTTLMRSIVGVQIVEAGTVRVLGLPAGSPPLWRRVGYVTQEPSVYGDMSVRENLRYFARILGAPSSRIDEAIDEVDLRAQADQLTRTLSGGERSRVSLATALLGRPELLVLDEPTVGLDPVLRRDLWTLFHELARDGKDAARLQPRDGRGRALRRARADARRHGRGDRVSERPARAHRRHRPRGGVPDAGGGSMSAARTLATAERVLRQLRHDRRTLALVFVVPPFLLTLFRYVFDGQPETFDRVGGPLVGIFPFTSMFLVTSIAMLRERTSGTLERLMSMPIARGDLLGGYGLAFAAVAAVQASITSAVAFGLLGLDTAGPIWAVVLIAVANALLGMALGLFLSAFATTEFQAVQFMPAVVIPQILLCGLLVPRDEMAEPLEWLSNLLPLTYAYDALEQVTASGETDAGVWLDVGIVAACIVLALALGSATLRRRTP